MLRRVLITMVISGLLGWAGRYVYLQLQEEQICTVCHRAVHEQTSFRIHLRGGETQEVCCPRCGLRFIQARDDVTGVDVADFDTGERFDAKEAFYVENSSVNLCSRHTVEKDGSGVQYDLAWDRCLPSLIAFKNRAAAAAFRSRNGGSIKLYDELLQEEF